MSKTDIIKWIREHQSTFTNLAQDIWDHPQIAYEETYASKLQMDTLQDAGFTIINPISGISTAFIAEFGQGKPIIGILGEFDALPGLSQKASATQEQLEAGGPGHGCGHNLLGTAGVEAVIALKEKMETENIQGTIRYYGCPAEEVLSGKTHMAKEGVFDDLDCALTWHPGSGNTVMNKSMQAMVSVKFHFKGITAHAAAAPHAGRSALDSVEIMNVGANYLREHVRDGTRIHYVITNGGLAPNIVPEAASVWYFLRARTKTEVEDILRRVNNIAQGAALMNETEVESEILAFPYETIPNDSLNRLMYKNMKASDPLVYTDDEQVFAKQIVGTLGTSIKAEEILPTDISFDEYDPTGIIPGSSDVGDVSWITPTGFIMTTCSPIGVALHSWQATASFGTTVGYKGMHLAASSMALTAYDLFVNKDNVLEEAKEEFSQRINGVKYVAGI